MEDYISKLLDEVPYSMDVIAKTPAACHLFNINEGSYAVHPYMKSHPGIFMSIVKGVMYTLMYKQKIKTKSSTEAEIVARDYAMVQIPWTRHFLVSQALPVPVTTIYQDNKSTILLLENGKASSSICTKHLNVQYFFVNNQIKRGRRVLPSENMLADFFTKPFQGCNIPANVQTHT